MWYLPFVRHLFEETPKCSFYINDFPNPKHIFLYFYMGFMMEWFYNTTNSTRTSAHCISPLLPTLPSILVDPAVRNSNMGVNWEYKQWVLHWYRCIPIVWDWLLRLNWWLLLPCIQNVWDLNVPAEDLIDGSCCHVFQIYLINIPGEGLIGGSCCHIFQMSGIKVLAGGLIGGSCCHVFQMSGIYVPAEYLIDGSCCRVSQMSRINVPTADLIDGSCCHVVILKIIIKFVQ